MNRADIGHERTSTGYMSPSWKEFICPSGKRPLGKRDKSTNSGSVSNSSRESVNRAPLCVHISETQRRDEEDHT